MNQGRPYSSLLSSARAFAWCVVGIVCVVVASVICEVVT